MPRAYTNSEIYVRSSLYGFTYGLIWAAANGPQLNPLVWGPLTILCPWAPEGIATPVTIPIIIT